MADGSPLAHSPTLTATPPGDEDGQALPAGTTVGEYVVERFIGAGATGEVYAGRHPVIGKRVAIKVLRPDLAASSEAAERFIREARAANQIEHENVVDVFAFGRTDDGRLYLVMDLVLGRPLRALLVDGPLEHGKALAILDAIAGALDAAHARGVVHRDLKPDNVVVANAPPHKVFVLDFGIAKLLSTATTGGPTAPGTLTGQGTWLGTPGYMAPEQWSADGAGPASDRYALGVIAFELLSGAPPFSATSVPAMMEQHFRAEVPALSSRGAVGVPAAVDAVLRRALAKDPDARFPTARAFVDALRAAAGSSTRGAVAVRGPRRKPWLPAVAGTGVLGIAIVVVLLSRRDTTAPHASPPPRDEPVPGMVPLAITSTPGGAEVEVDGQLRGTTPLMIEVKRGEARRLMIVRPGYVPEQRTVTPDDSTNAVTVALQEVTRFTGTWRLPDGQLRELRRNGDQVDVFKRTSAHGGDAVFFKRYAFVRADRGIAFGADDEIVDPRAPNDPQCHVRVRVEYRYDPASDVLEQQRDKVSIGFVDGSCVVQSRVAVPAQLVRVDQVDDTVERSAPVGRIAVPTKNVKPVPATQRKDKGKAVLLEQKAALTQKKREQALKAPPQQTVAPQAKNVVEKPAASYTQPSSPAAANAQDSSQVQIRKK